MRTAQRPVPAIRSGVEWAVRIVLAIGLALLGFEACKQALAAAVRSADPQRAYSLAPSDGRVLGLLSQDLVDADASVADRTTADRLARQALRNDPTVVAAVATLGLSTQLRGDTAQARRIFGYSEKLSRRDLRTQLWSIEDSVSRGDVRGALRHYDIALRTSRQASDLLFPVLASAISDANVRLELARIIAQKPRWTEIFIPYVAGNVSDPLAVATLFRRIAAAAVTIPPASQAIVVARLIAADRLDQAWTYYASIRPGARRERSRDPHFTNAVIEPTPFDWTPIDDSNVIVSVQRARVGGRVEFSVPAGDGGPMLSQLQLLPPGDYDLRGRSGDIAQVVDARPYWALACEKGRELGRAVLPNSDQFGGRFGGRFTVPPDCPVQRLLLVARPSDAVEGLVGRIEHVSLQPSDSSGR